LTPLQAALANDFDHFDPNRVRRTPPRPVKQLAICSIFNGLTASTKGIWNLARPDVFLPRRGEPTMGRYLLLWLLGIPIPILVLIWMFGGLH
jgi:hypothetical protein